MTRVALIGLIAAGGSGIPRYAQEISKALAPVAATRRELEISLITTPRGRERIGDVDLPVTTVGRRWAGFDSGPARILREQLAAATARAALVHFFDFTGPILAPRRAFTFTAHDAAWLSVTDAYSSLQHRFRARLLPWAARRARGVVAVSDFAAHDVVSRLGVEPARVQTILSGPGMPIRPGTPGAPGPQGPPYLLYVGNLSPSKNLPLLIRAFDAAAPDARLVIVGRPRPGWEEVAEAARAARSRDRIAIVGDASDEDVEALYRSALALVLPSRYEGFGFTPLEAMARDCPVIASDLPAVREVSGEAALLVAADDEAGWADALRRVVADEALRADLRRRGAERVTRYSWARSAGSLYDFLVTHAAGGR